MTTLQADGAHVAGDQLLLFHRLFLAHGQAQAGVAQPSVVVVQRQVVADRRAGVGHVGHVQGVAGAPGVPVTLGAQREAVDAGGLVLGAANADGTEVAVRQAPLQAQIGMPLGQEIG